MAEIVSGVFSERQRSAAPPIAGVNTSIGAFLGIAERGPVNTPTLVGSWEEYRRIFGGHLLAHPALPIAVQGFFANGGQQCWIVRTAHHTDIEDPDSITAASGTLTIQTASAAESAARVDSGVAAPFTLTPGAQLVIDVDGDGGQTATFDAAAASVTGDEAGPFELTNGQTLQVAANGGSTKTVTFQTAMFESIGAATIDEVVAAINGVVRNPGASDSMLASGDGSDQLVIETDKRGTGASIEIVGGTALEALGLEATTASGTGDVADISAVTAAEIKTVVEADMSSPQIAVTVLSGNYVRFLSPTTGTDSTIQVSSGTVQAALNLSTATVTGQTGAPVNTLRIDARYPGDYSGNVTVQRRAATSGESTRFDLLILEGGVARSSETFRNASMDPSDPRYIVTLVNRDPSIGGSQLVTVTDLEAAVDDPRPDVGTFGPLTGGDSGLTSLADNDFVGAVSSTGDKTGLRLFDQLEGRDAPAILVVPHRSANSAVANAMVTYAEFTRKNMIAVLDPPELTSARGMRDHVVTTAGLYELSEYAATYWPRIKIDNPDTDVFGTGETITVAPSGHIAGVYARVDAHPDAGVSKAPAGPTQGVILGAVGVELDEVKDKDAREIVVQARVNPIRPASPTPGASRSVVYLDDCLTLRSEEGGAIFPLVPQNRLAIYIEQSILVGLEPLRQTDNTAEGRRVVNMIVSAFMKRLRRQNAFAVTDDTAFQVDTSDAINPPDSVERGVMNIGLAWYRKSPARQIFLSISALTQAQ